MTNQEAIKILNDSEADMDYSYADIMKAHCMGVQALEKQIPKSPYQNQDDGIWECPNCETQLDDVTNYCSMCGQRLMNDEVEE